MMFMKRPIATTLLAVVFSISIAQAPAKSPTFALKATNGVTYGVPGAKAKPMVIVFFRAGCPHNPKSANDLNRLAAALKGKATLVAMTNLAAGEVKAYAKEIKTQLPLMADPKATIIRSFGASHSLDMVAIAPGGKVIAFYDGYSRTRLAELSAKLAPYGQGVSLDISKYPEKIQSGCGF